MKEEVLRKVETMADELFAAIRRDIPGAADVRIMANEDGYANIDVSLWGEKNAKGTYEGVKRRYLMYASRISGTWMDGSERMNDHLESCGLLLKEGAKESA